MKNILFYIISACFAYLMISCDATTTVVRYESYNGGTIYSLQPRYIHPCPPPPPPIIERRVYFNRPPVQPRIMNNRGRQFVRR